MDVIQNNWRSTQVLTPANNFVFLPNSKMEKIGLTNLTWPDETHLIVLAVRIAVGRRPSEMENVLKATLLSCQNIVQTSSPIVALKGIDAIALDVELQFRATAPAGRTPARNEVIDMIHQHCSENKLSFVPSARILLLLPRHRARID